MCGSWGSSRQIAYVLSLTVIFPGFDQVPEPKVSPWLPDPQMRGPTSGMYYFTFIPLECRVLCGFCLVELIQIAKAELLDFPDFWTLFTQRMSFLGIRVSFSFVPLERRVLLATFGY